MGRCTKSGAPSSKSRAAAVARTTGAAAARRSPAATVADRPSSRRPGSSRMHEGECAVSQRVSGYERLPDDAYYTPQWVVEALLPHIPKRVTTILEPAAGNGAIVKVLQRAGYK